VPARRSYSCTAGCRTAGPGSTSSTRWHGGGLRCAGHDRRGHGRSDTPDGGYDYDTLADDLASLLQTLDLREVTLVGHSMGGGEIVRYLTRRGGIGWPVSLWSRCRCRRCAIPDNPEAMDPRTYQTFVSEIRPDRPRFLAAWGQAFFGTHLGNWVSAEGIGAMLEQARLTSPLAALACRDSVFHADFREELGRLDVPTLVVHGTGYVNSPVEKTGRRTAAPVPHALYKEYANAAHGLFMTPCRPAQRRLAGFHHVLIKQGRDGRCSRVRSQAGASVCGQRDRWPGQPVAGGQPARQQDQGGHPLARRADRPAA
jgi:non-heme chloroperoxidase